MKQGSYFNDYKKRCSKNHNVKYVKMENMENKTKICNKCNREKPIEEFRLSKSGKDGRRCECRDCQNEMDRERYRKNREFILAKKKEYQEKNRNKILEQKRKHKQDFARFDTFYDKFLPYYCENEMCQDPENPELIQFRCKYCGDFFNPTVSQVEHRYQSIVNGFGGRELYCSEACKTACPTYNRTKYPRGFKNGTSREVQAELRKMVLERDNWTCQRCGKSKAEFPELELHCHHIFPINEDPIRSADIDNCITFCRECHEWIHKNIPDCGKRDLICTEKI